MGWLFMNKRANLYLNIFELLSFLIMICLTELYLYFNTLPGVIKLIILFISAISAFLFISIELFLFLLLNKKSKAIYILYLFLDLGISIYFTIKIPYAYFVLFLLFSTIKNIFRVVLVETIYIPKEFNRYCKMFGITISDFKEIKKKRKKKQLIVIPVEKEEKQKSSKKKKETKENKESEATL